MQAQPQQQHQWLTQLVGKWTFESECSMGPDQPPSKFGGHEVIRSIGGLWILAEGGTEMPGGGIGHTVMTLGYDPARSSYIGTFVASMMTHLWTYDGTVDADERVLTLDTQGPSFTGSGTAPYKDIITLVSGDHRILTSQYRADDGQWHHFMTAHYRRQQ